MEELKDQIDEIKEQLQEAKDAKRRKDKELEQVKRKIEEEAELIPHDGRKRLVPSRRTWRPVRVCPLFLLIPPLPHCH